MKKLLKSKKFQVGFTLIELLIVVAIIVVLITIGAVSYTTVNRNARNAQRQTDLNKIAAALEDFHADHGFYPSTFHVPAGILFQSGGRSPQDQLTCLLGGTNNTSFVANPGMQNTCDYRDSAGKVYSNLPDNIYLANGDRFKIPSDPLFNDITLPEANYNYASDGQTFALVSPLFEGDASVDKKFTPSDPYWSFALAWNSDINFWNNNLVIHQPNK